jgi:hypothetical protein
MAKMGDAVSIRVKVSDLPEFKQIVHDVHKEAWIEGWMAGANLEHPLNEVARAMAEEAYEATMTGRPRTDA